jgi:hypothetical protein
VVVGGTVHFSSAFERSVVLDGGWDYTATASGMAAITTTVLATCGAGGHVLLPELHLRRHVGPVHPGPAGLGDHLDGRRLVRSGHALQQGLLDELQHRDATQQLLEFVQVTTRALVRRHQRGDDRAPALVPATRGNR